MSSYSSDREIALARVLRNLIMFPQIEGGTQMQPKKLSGAWGKSMRNRYLGHPFEERNRTPKAILCNSTTDDKSTESTDMHQVVHDYA